MNTSGKYSVVVNGAVAGCGNMLLPAYYNYEIPNFSLGVGTSTAETTADTLVLQEMRSKVAVPVRRYVVSVTNAEFVVASEYTAQLPTGITMQLAEVGALVGGSLFSRARMRDSAGDVTVVDVQATDVISIVYSLEYTVPLAAEPVTLEFEGTSVTGHVNFCNPSLWNNDIVGEPLTDTGVCHVALNEYTVDALGIAQGYGSLHTIPTTGTLSLSPTARRQSIVVSSGFGVVTSTFNQLVFKTSDTPSATGVFAILTLNTPVTLSERSILNVTLSILQEAQYDT